MSNQYKQYASPNEPLKNNRNLGISLVLGCLEMKSITSLSFCNSVEILGLLHSSVNVPYNILQYSHVPSDDGLNSKRPKRYP